MHELSIAQAIVDVAARHAGPRRVERVHVRIGRLRQVVPSALAFSFELCAHGTPVDGAALEIEPVAIGAVCRPCQTESELAGFPLACPRCGSLDVEVLRGEELQVESLELQEELITNGG
ncbi:MAG: hydrogenase maturation nickel metallochaperone HypA [Actinomycetota bacterium]|nr:hydrogenase maturation nickel metallochaperone HypA [Actinomycetota bacterium]